MVWVWQVPALPVWSMDDPASTDWQSQRGEFVLLTMHDETIVLKQAVDPVDAPDDVLIVVGEPLPSWTWIVPRLPVWSVEGI